MSEPTVPEEEVKDAAAAPVEPEADGYYGEEELEDGELDLSFLDEEDEDEAKDSKPVENK